VPLAYQTMSVLMNYKRTVEDFGECGTKAGNPYNFPFLSDCVRVGYDKSSPKCEDPAKPVGCKDGACRPDYISCLKAIVSAEEERGTPAMKSLHDKLSKLKATELLVEKGEFSFNHDGFVDKIKDEDKDKEASASPYST
jgi:hypothetical protein